MSSHQEFAHLQISLEEIQEATNDFADENLIGQDAFGKVYTGNLLVSGQRTNIAARRLHYEYGQGDLEFWTEITMLSDLKHNNLVSFIGFCDEKDEKIIINKHESHESLDKYLKGSVLTWLQRLQICVGIARALNYIHYDAERNYSVIHRNIKSSKILLDDNWEPKLSGFELAMRNTSERRHRLLLAEVIGTIGYMDPTYEKTGFVTHKSDVYSFGVVLFELLCGRKTFIPNEQDQQRAPQYAKSDNKEEKAEDVNKQSHPPTVSAQAQQSLFTRVWLSLFNCFSPSTDTQQSPFTDVESYSFIRVPRLLSPFTGVPSSPLCYGQEWLSLFPDVHSDEPEPFNNEPHSLIDNEPHPLDNAQPTSFVDREPTSFANSWQSSFGEIMSPRMPIKLPNSSKEQGFALNPLFTMKRLDQYSHAPYQELLAQLARSHYDEENLDDIIDPYLRDKMDPESFKIFSETAYNCLKEQRAQRPNIDQILRNLEKALVQQMKRENPGPSIVAGEVEGKPSNSWKGENLEHLKIPLTDIVLATKNFTKRYLGSGTYGRVYRAELELSIEEKGEHYKKWRTVAIKCIREDKHGKEGFIAEIELLTRCKHDNIVSLLGFCDEGNEMI
ncbi:putative protein kinase RLK-Pelle-CR4L family [Helianthus annuus]|nr:putative protein kinase RLK-Pelle-CR4L family [Helianthus annuus]